MSPDVEQDPVAYCGEGHPDQEVLERFFDGTPDDPTGDDDAIQIHVDDCRSCGEALYAMQFRSP